MKREKNAHQTKKLHVNGSKNVYDKRKSLAEFNVCIISYTMYECVTSRCNAEAVVCVWILWLHAVRNSSIVPPQWRSCSNVCTISWSVFILKLHTQLSQFTTNTYNCVHFIESSSNNTHTHTAILQRANRMRPLLCVSHILEFI